MVADQGRSLAPAAAATAAVSALARVSSNPASSSKLTFTFSVLPTSPSTGV